jgi:hypothetical protein
MRIYYDSEFNENGETIELLSMGMVAEDGREYYAIVNDLEVMYRATENPWLLKNVLNQFPLTFDDWNLEWNPSHKDFSAVKPKDQIRNEVKKFLQDTPELELWAWYGSYDHVALAQLFGRMIDLPVGIPMWTNDLRQELHRLGNPRIPEQQGGNHNALEDARWNTETGKYLESISQDFTANPKRTRIW